MILILNFKIFSYLQIVYILIYREQIYELNKAMIHWYNNELQKEENRNTILESFQMFYIPSYNLFILISFFSCVQFFAPMIGFGLQWIRGVNPIVYKLTVPSMFPIENGGIVFYIEYLHVIAVTIALTLGTGLDLLYVYFTYMSNKLIYINIEKVKKYQVDHDIEDLHDIIKAEQIIRRQTHNVNDVYGYPILVLFLTSSLVLCTSSFQLSKVSYMLSFTCVLTIIKPDGSNSYPIIWLKG